jgi:hypothetical protein
MVPSSARAGARAGLDPRGPRGAEAAAGGAAWAAGAGGGGQGGLARRPQHGAAGGAGAGPGGGGGEQLATVIRDCVRVRVRVWCAHSLHDALWHRASARSCIRYTWRTIRCTGCRCSARRWLGGCCRRWRWRATELTVAPCCDNLKFIFSPAQSRGGRWRRPRRRRPRRRRGRGGVACRRT